MGRSKDNPNTMFIGAVSILIAICMQLPGVAKIMHAVDSHITEHCDSEPAAHLHSLELDCEFQKLQYTSQYFEFSENHSLVKVIIPQKYFPHYYEFLSAFQSLNFSLRGPPINS